MTARAPKHAVFMTQRTMPALSAKARRGFAPGSRIGIFGSFTGRIHRHRVIRPNPQATFVSLLPKGVAMSLRLLAALPFIGILIGVPFVNRTEPLVLGMPLVLAWIVMWVVLTAAIMGIVYKLDPRNRAPQDAEVRS